MDLTQQEHKRLSRALGHRPHRVEIVVERALGPADLVEWSPAGTAAMVVEPYTAPSAVVIDDEHRAAFMRDELLPRLLDPADDDGDDKDFGPESHRYTALLCLLRKVGLPDRRVLFCRMQH